MQVNGQGVISCSCHGCEQWRAFTAGKLAYRTNAQGGIHLQDDKSHAGNDEPDKAQAAGAKRKRDSNADKRDASDGSDFCRGVVQYEVFTREMLLALAQYIW